MMNEKEACKFAVEHCAAPIDKDHAYSSDCIFGTLDHFRGYELNFSAKWAVTRHIRANRLG
jgi:hypothetical protein